MTRTDRKGTVILSDVRTASDGTFSFTDRTHVRGEVTWTIIFDGTERLTASSTGWTVFSRR